MLYVFRVGLPIGSQWLPADTGGIAYFGFSYYVSNADLLTVVRVASDRILGVVDTADAKVEPSIYTITDGSYSVYKRQLFMNVDNTAWDRVHPYLSYGFSEAGQRQVSEVLRVGHEEYQQTAEACSHPLLRLVRECWWTRGWAMERERY